MEMFKCFLAATCFNATFVLVIHAQDQSGFISIDCGIPEGSSYTDEATGINYVSDAGFIDTGVNQKLSPEINTTDFYRQYLNLRSFPDGVKGCYALKPARGKNHRYLIRATFLYGNYDNESHVPHFNLYLGANWWATVRLQKPSLGLYYEIIHVPQIDGIDICLVNTGFGTPFISVLELRPLDDNAYVTADGDRAALVTFSRYDYGSSSSNRLRYPDDVYDRFWNSFNDDRYETLPASSVMESVDRNYMLPSTVMETAEAPANATDSIKLYFSRNDPTTQFYAYLYFAEIQNLSANELREFNIYRNDELWHGPIAPRYLHTTVTHSASTTQDEIFYVTINKTVNSTLPPLLNAYEIYYVRELLKSETYQQDVDAIMDIKSTYKLKKYWQGDPCEPEIAIWEGLNCSYNEHNPPRITSLILSSSGLTGPIPASISKLTMLEYLDLSNNALTGSVPNFLSQLQYLRVLNLAGNKLSGPVPQGLIDRSNNGSLSLNMHDNVNICSSYLCKHKFIVPLVATVGVAVLVLLVSSVIFWTLKRRNKESISEGYEASKQFTYSEVLNITNNLERVVGKGNFGTVYHGYIDDTPVAVKVFSASFIQESKQFRADAKLITGVHNRYLAPSFGYFEKGKRRGLIYEFMTNGSLEDILSGKNAVSLSWQERLQIAIDVAQGLDYLHNGCRPPIIHGNLRPTNILLNENYQAMLVDFGLSKIFKVEGLGTTEYLDPEYHVTNKLTERSDVFSFGVVLLATITSRNNTTTMINMKEKKHVSQWVSSLIAKGDIKNVIDPSLRDEFCMDSAWKAVEVAMECVSLASAKRPDIRHVVLGLNQCLAMEITRINSLGGGGVELVTVNMGSGSGLIPKPR